MKIVTVQAVVKSAADGTKESLMGLDMYLHAKTYFNPFRDEEKAKSEEIVKIAGLEEYLQPEGFIQLTVEAMYWRKANAIHEWFVVNVQGGNDDCNDYYVPIEKLIELKSECDKVIANPELAMETLPPSSGFFFGSTDIDEWYMNQLKYTSRRIKEIVDLQNKNGDKVMFYYHSSW